MSAHPQVLGLTELLALPRRPRVVAIGNFDGVHRGHQQLLQALEQPAQLHDAPCCALTFHPHPATLVAPERTPLPLVSLEDRIALLKAAGASEVVVLRFDEQLRHLSPEAFAETVLAEGLGARHVAVGANFRFAHRQQGDLAVLTELGARYGFGVTGVPLLTERGLPLSSSQIRALIRKGDVTRAARYLSRPFSLTGPIIRGRGVGSVQTVPTLNLAVPALVLPADGVYVTRVLDLSTGLRMEGITNVGVRPTFDDGHLERSIETFILGPLLSEPVAVRLEFLARLREERRFASPDALKAQILADVARARSVHRRVARWRPAVFQSR